MHELTAADLPWRTCILRGANNITSPSACERDHIPVLPVESNSAKTGLTQVDGYSN